MKSNAMPVWARNPRGFTLIELLVVIAIIAILAAILFPVFAKAREKAFQANCMSNQKQLAASILMYVQDHDETFPAKKTWVQDIDVKDPKVFRCPSSDNRGEIISDYGFNGKLSEVALGDVINPHSAELTADVGRTAEDGSFSLTSLFEQQSYRHNNGAMAICSFADGHVEVVKNTGRIIAGLSDLSPYSLMKTRNGYVDFSQFADTASAKAALDLVAGQNWQDGALEGGAWVWGAATGAACRMAIGDNYQTSPMFMMIEFSVDSNTNFLVDGWGNNGGIGETWWKYSSDNTIKNCIMNIEKSATAQYARWAGEFSDPGNSAVKTVRFGDMDDTLQADAQGDEFEVPGGGDFTSGTLNLRLLEVIPTRIVDEGAEAHAPNLNRRYANCQASLVMPTGTITYNGTTLCHNGGVNGPFLVAYGAGKARMTKFWYAL